MTDYKATPEQWEDIEKWGDEYITAACILELRARVEALEATQKLHQDKLDQLIALDTEDSLVERVKKAIGHTYPNDARAAILEVAAWMTGNPDLYFPPSLVFALEQEAER